MPLHPKTLTLTYQPRPDLLQAGPLFKKMWGPLIYPAKSVWPVQPLGATNPCTDSLTHSSRTVYYVIATFLSKRNSKSQRLATFTAQNQGRLNQWAHWARAQGPRIFFLFERPPTGCGEIRVPKAPMQVKTALHKTQLIIAC